MKRFISVICTLCMIAAVVCVGSFTAGAAVETHTITFDVQGIGETPEPVVVADGESFLYLRENSSNNPTAEGYAFNCWVTTLDYPQDNLEIANHAAYLETPIHEDITLYAVWYKLVDKVDITVDPPVAGDVIGTDWYETEDFSFEFQDPRPKAKVTSEGVQVKDSFWSAIGPATFWLEDADDNESIFKGTFEDGKEYGVSIDTEPLFGYQFADEVTVTVNGEKLDKKLPADDFLLVVRAPIWCGQKPAESEKTDNKTATSDEAKKGATSDQGKKSDDKSTTLSASGANSNAVQTGGATDYIPMIIVMILSFCVIVCIRLKSKN